MTTMHAKIAIVGAGPSGCYLAQALLKAEPGLQIDLIEALPVPFGLLRYGVAADHQGTKAVVRQFERVFERQGAQFFGNVQIGRDLGLSRLRKAYDAVVLATGLAMDRPLAIPGGELAGVVGAGALTRAFYEHPDAAALPELGRDPLIVGNGNVAIDILRLLAKSPDELDGTDLGSDVTAWLARQDVQSVTIVGRSPAGAAKFDPAMIRELAKLENVNVSVADVDLEGADVCPRKAALAALAGHKTGPLAVRFRFGLRPVSVEGEQRATGLRFDGSQGQETIACSSVISAIGFDYDPQDPFAGLVRGACDLKNGQLADGLFATGWFRRGPRGTIPDSRADAQLVSARILAQLDPDPSKAGRAILSALPAVVTYAGWKRIDDAELKGATPGRCRRKLASRNDLMKIATPEYA